MKRFKSFGLLLLTCAIALMLVACTSSEKEQQTTEQPKKQQTEQATTVRLPGSDWGFPSPYLHNPRGPGFYNMFLIFDGLLEKDDKGMIPWLAKEYEVSGDGKTYTFTLQENVKWHDGKPFTAEDVKFSFEYFVKHPPVRNTLFMNGQSNVEKVDIVSPTKVAVTVKKVAVTNLEKLGWTRMIPKHIWENVADPSTFQDKEALIGTGPFQLTDYKKEEGAYRYEAFADFWGPKQTVQVIEQVPVSDPVLAFENGELDYTMISEDVVEKFTSQGFKVEQDPPFFGTRLMFNMEGPFADKNLRQAIAYAINKEELVEKVLRGAGIPGNAGYLSPANQFYNENVQQYDYNPEKAKQLLAGKTYTFTLKTAQNQTAKADPKLAEAIKMQLEKVGITVNIVASDLTTNDEYVNKGDYELILQTLGGFGSDPDGLRELFRTKKQGNAILSAKLYGYSNAELDKLADAQLVELDKEKRAAIVDQMQEIIAEDIPVLPIYYKTASNVIRNDVYDGWMYMYDHHWSYHAKLSYLQKD